MDRKNDDSRLLLEQVNDLLENNKGTENQEKELFKSVNKKEEEILYNRKNSNMFVGKVRV